MAGSLADPPAHLVAVDTRHHDVEQHQVRAALGQRGQRLLAGLRAADVVAARASAIASSSLTFAGWSSTTSTRTCSSLRHG